MTSSWAIESNVPLNRCCRRRRESRSFSSLSQGTKAVDFPFGLAVAEEAMKVCDETDLERRVMEEVEG